MKKYVHMHKIILGDKEGLEIDHKDGNGLNNRKDNIRWATKAQNQANSAARSGRYKGVSPPQHRRKRWKAEIRCKGIRYDLGCFDTEEDAARAYDAKAKELHGEFARLNFPE